MEVAAHSRLQSEKVQHLTRAIELAKQNEDKDLLATAQRKLVKIAPRHEENPSPKDWLGVAYDLRKSRRFDEARSYYRRVLEEKTLTDVDHYQALDGIRLAFKLEKRVDDYVTATQELASFELRKFVQKFY